MMSRSISLVSVPVLMFALACDPPGDGPSGSDDLEAPAAELMGLLVESRLEEFASRMHYPDIYTPDQLAEDRAGVEKSLGILLREVGAIEGYERSEQRGPFLQVNVTGGDDSYWQTHPVGRSGSAVVFDAEFATIGEGVVQIGFANTPDGRQVRNVGIGGRASRADARATMESIMAKFKEAGVATSSKAP